MYGRRVALARLPIDDVMPEVVAGVATRKTCVLVAPPGAGKTTRVPGALLDAGVIEGSIVVLQPRRLAARLAATRIASERGVELGGEVGYQVRFDRKISARTRIELVTEVSATFVARITLRRVAGRTAATCSSAVRSPCSGITARSNVRAASK